MIAAIQPHRPPEVVLEGVFKRGGEDPLFLPGVRFHVGADRAGAGRRQAQQWRRGFLPNSSARRCIFTGVEQFHPRTESCRGSPGTPQNVTRAETNPEISVMLSTLTVTP